MVVDNVGYVVEEEFLMRQRRCHTCNKNPVCTCYAQVNRTAQALKVMAQRAVGWTEITMNQIDVLIQPAYGIAFYCPYFKEFMPSDIAKSVAGYPAEPVPPACTDVSESSVSGD